LLQKASWIAYGINLIIPIIIAAALIKFLNDFEPLQSCQTNREVLRTSAASEGASRSSYTGPYTVLAPLESYYPPTIYTGSGSSGVDTISAYIGPASEFSGTVQDDLYAGSVGSLFRNTYGSYDDNGNYIPPVQNSSYSADEALSTRRIVNDTAAVITGITNSTASFSGFAIFAPTPETAVLFHRTADYDAAIDMRAFNLITNRIRNSSTTTGTAKVSFGTIRTMRHIENNVNFLSLPITVLIVLGFVTAASIAVIYPAFEKINRVRALHYCNGVSPFALWLGYLLFDLQFIIIQSFFVWGLVFAGVSRLWYAPAPLLGVFILFGIATYLGTYVLSLFVRKAAFAVAAGLHVLLVVLYLVSYIMVQSFGEAATRPDTYSYLQYGFGLSSPGANLCRALWLASNTFESLCGKYGDADTSYAFAYVRYGSVYTNLCLQILFLVAFLAIYEYGSSEWFRRNITHRGRPSRLHYIVENGPVGNEQEKNATAGAETSSATEQILQVSQISKYFGKVFAAENISFNVAAKQTLALLGGNGAGKTTVINMIRGELKPDFGDIHLDNTSVLRNPHKARLHMGVCPQDDAVDNLTVRQTLAFYASVKGLKNVESNVDKVLTALNITIYEHLQVKALSGGTKRKLSVAIALLG
jgi:ATP-binding cassette subfamily A (ABC1) protein 3